MTIDTCNFKGLKAIVRVDFNVPLDENGHVTDDTRIRGALPTLKKILADGGALIIMSHMGKPKGEVKPELSLQVVADRIAELLGKPVVMAKDVAGEDAACEGFRRSSECASTCQACAVEVGCKVSNSCRCAGLSGRSRDNQTVDVVCLAVNLCCSTGCEVNLIETAITVGVQC